MKRQKILMATLVGALFSPLVGAAGDARPASAPQLTAEQIVERNINARGGQAAWQRIRSLTMSGQLDAGRERVDGGRIGLLASPHARAEMKAMLRKAAQGKGEESAGKVVQLPFRMDLQRPGKSRVEISFKGDTAVQVYDGSQGWKLRPFIGRHEVEAFTADEARLAAQQQELDGPLIDHAAKGTQVALEGVERLDGRNAYKLKLIVKDGEVRHLWVDAQSFLDVRFDGEPRRFDGRMRTVSTYFHDYKPVNGVMLPYLLETVVDGAKTTQRIVIEKIALNPPLEDARFARPE
jgi:hypothetical protein